MIDYNNFCLEQFEEAYRDGRVSRQEHDGYVIFKYKAETQYAKDWDEITLSSRGIIFDLETKECIALPFKKFFNLNETNCKLSEFPSDPNYEILEKMDGSMGCIFLNKDEELYISTPGSFLSDQAIWATNWIRSYDKYEIIRDKFLNGDVKVLVAEIICHLSKVVVPYDFEGLVIISAQDDSGRYFDHNKLEFLSEECGIPVCRKFNFSSIENLKDYLSTVEDFEGFVLHWVNSGFRLKIKGEDYIKKHRILSSIHPNRVDEAIEESDNNLDIIFENVRNVLREFPEEYVDLYNKAVNEWIDDTLILRKEICNIVDNFDGCTNKDLAMWLKSDNSDNKYSSKLFSHVMNAFYKKENFNKLSSLTWQKSRDKYFSN